MKLTIVFTLGLVLAGCGSPTGRSSVQASPETSGGSLDAGAPSDEEAVQIQAIARAVNQRALQVHDCWAKGAADNLNLAGTVTLLAEFAADHSAQIRVLKEDVNNAVLVDCLVELWRKHRWPAVFGAGDKIQLPPFVFVAPSQRYMISSRHIPVLHLANGKLDVQVIMDRANSGMEAVAVSQLWAHAGAKVPMHIHESSWEVLFMLAGTGMVHSAGKDVEVGPGSAISVAPGVAHGFTVTGEERAEFIQFYGPGGPEQRFKDPSRQDGTTPVTKPLKKNMPKPTITNVVSVPAKVLAPGIKAHELLTDEQFHLQAKIATPGADMASGQKETTKVIFVLEGQAEYVIDGRSYLAQPGDVVQIPAYLSYSAFASGTVPLKSVELYGRLGSRK